VTAPARSAFAPVRSHLKAWAEYLYGNERAQRAYERDRDTIDTRYHALAKKSQPWYRREVLGNEDAKTQSPSPPSG
jgi:hypothetical protein